MLEITEKDLMSILPDEISYYAYIYSTQPMCFSDDTTGNYLDVNNAFLSMLGYRKEEVIGKNPLELAMFADSLQGEKVLGQLIKNRKLHDHPVEIRTKRGEKRYGKITTTILKINGIDIRFTVMKDETDRIRYENKLTRMFQQSISAISKISEMRDVYTAGHQKKVAKLARMIACEMGLPEQSGENIAVGALLHDIGKIYIASEILNKTSRLSLIERKMIQAHPLYGYEVAKEIDFPPEVPVMIHQHHERLDGSGYPEGLKGKQILLESRILAVADVVDAMSSHRPYRPALQAETVIDEIISNKGAKYDGDVVEACLRILDRKAQTIPLSLTPDEDEI